MTSGEFIYPGGSRDAVRATVACPKLPVIETHFQRQSQVMSTNFLRRLLRTVTLTKVKLAGVENSP